MSQYHPILFFLQLGVLLSLGVAGYCGYRLRRHGRSLIVLSVGLLAVSVAIYNGAAAMKTASPTLPAKLWWYKLEFLGSGAIPSIAVTLALAYLGEERWLTRPVVGILVGIPAVAVPLIMVNPGSVMIVEPTLVEVGGIQALEHDYPPLFVMVAAWGEGATLLAALLVVGSGLFGNARRAPALMLGVALGLPYGALMLKTLHVYPPGGEGINLAPVFETGSLAVVALAIARYRLFDLLPVGRSKAFAVMDDGYMLVDATGTIIDANEAARTLLGGERLTSRAVAAAVPQLSGPGGTGDPVATRTSVGAGAAIGTDDIVETGSRVDAAGHDEAKGGEEAAGPPPAPVVTATVVTATVEGRTLQIRSSPVRDGAATIGRVFVLRDITPLRVREQALEEENERLDRFARVLSHDLRNPLNVAQGRLQLAKETSDDPGGHLASVERSLGRMNEIIQDMLLLTWSKQELRLEDLGPVDLGVAAREAWGNVEASRATLQVASSMKIRGHEGRLRQLLENLFRNAVEHGSETVLVTVGTLSNEPPSSSERALRGFFVEDNGPGISEEKRGTVLKAGHSSREKGTGLGLSIVHGIAEAHGWSMLVTESGAESAVGSRGRGARFEFRDERGPGA